MVLAAMVLPSPAAVVGVMELVLAARGGAAPVLPHLVLGAAAAALPSPAAALGAVVLVLLAAAVLPSLAAGVNIMAVLLVFPNSANFAWLL